MSWITVLSNWMIPAVFIWILLYGCIKKNNVFESFVEGVNEGFRVVLDILPTFLGLIVAVGAMRASGLLEWLSGLLAPVGRWIRMPVLIVSRSRPISLFLRAIGFTAMITWKGRCWEFISGAVMCWFSRSTIPGSIRPQPRCFAVRG